MVTVPQVTLNDGTAIPQFGLGVYQVPPDDTAGLVRTALELGYRHVDTAQAYGNEAGVGQGLRDAGVAREDVWITTKLDDPGHTHDGAIAALERSLERLGTSYVDLYLIHRPGDGDDVDTWRAFTALRADGRARSIGLSNFDPRRIDRLVEATGVVPSVNQVRLNPRSPQGPLRRYHRRRGIATEAWAPLREGTLTRDRIVRRVADRHARTPAQVVLRWHLQHGFIVFPKASSAERLRENLDITDFVLTRRDLAELALLRRRP
ncbi:aldo/keto reductase [Actinomycetospora cinnamomea]|uniref:Diketogulonate reductase-like aldo/keto reductase n=1 Tax=Actinomycetospora cinnamomea TaxID=663609 RepID=A0A2U1FSC7_9PSEU|nr:aldo/keto reductase [Actinomycetospora cinnamomea]PVZ15058.1 diketogulonate reductase-like aldo/keto reductase [Actinomycetospora cinnamomea]